MDTPLQRALDMVASRSDQLLAESIRVAEIPAPPFREAERSAYIATRFQEAGLLDVVADGLGNVTGRWPGKSGGPRIMVVSHMDTVFPPGTDVTVRVEGDRAWGPGIRDNSSAVANLINLPPVLREAGIALPCDLTVAASVGEEGLGDLRGMRRLMEDWKDRVDAVVVYDGDFGSVVHGGVGSRRWKVTYTAPGGHSYGDYGKPSAIHGLVTACARFAQIQVPAAPKTTLNVGTIQGGSSINAIAETATAFIDMRSVGDAELGALAEEAEAIFRSTAAEMGCEVAVEEVGNRPGGLIADSHPLVQTAVAAVAAMGWQPRLSAGSTDANIPLAMGIPAVCIGGGKGGGAHSLKEYLEIPSLVPGLQHLIRMLTELDWPAVR